MTGKKWYEALLLIVFLAMAGLCVFLNLFSGQKEGMANIIVNVVMFIIVGFIFINCWLNSIRPMGQIIDELDAASEKIKKDARDSREYLWVSYHTSNTQLFDNEKLHDLYRDFLFELNRYSESKRAYYKCDIEDYINADLVDSVMHRNQLNQVAGALTGLGILGTFIGLSLGLQSFNIGSTAEINSSIAPLMNGIKVAFHTSIYGMIFSLVFNYVYKRRLYDAEEALNEFVNNFRKYVLPDTSNDGINLLIQAQQEQVEAINNMSTRMAEEVGKVIDPQFRKLSILITDFAHVATEDQKEALSHVVSAFVEQMNVSLEGSFTQMSNMVREQYALQQQNADIMRSVLKETENGVAGFQEINRQTSSLISTINDYSIAVESVQKEMNHSLANISAVNNTVSDIAAESQHTLKAEKELLMGLQGTLTGFSKQLNDTNKSSADHMETLTDALDDLRASLEKMRKK